MKTLRIGAGAGFSGDRIEPAIDLIEKCALDFVVFECLAERTIALAQQARRIDPERGYDPLLEARMRAVLPVAARHGTKVISNMGAANPLAAARQTREIAKELGLSHLKVAAITGDDVLDAMLASDAVLDMTGRPVRDLGNRIISANAYTGAGSIVDALSAGADIVLTGRAADPALFLAPLIHTFGWSMDDWERLGRGTVVGHLLECSAQVTGGYFADPGRKDVDNLAFVGFPFAVVSEDGSAVISKTPGSGGRVSRATCTEQLLYEIHDPAAYFQPDVVADFSAVTFDEIGTDEVQVGGASGRKRTGTLKVSVGYLDGFVGEGQITYAGPGAADRGALALDILRTRIERFGPAVDETRSDLIGIDSVARTDGARGAPREVRLRFSARCQTRTDAERIGAEVEGLYLCGPAGGGGVTRSVREVIAIASALLPEDALIPRIQMFED
ncbi:acyclic terpene utilization AtuA family protein [Acuticoccus kandeliae]|uniref:acyclic terpene utilization AtuA family protein n=1 Tax=Acuticoccus kandeliae TaxID=2073160 RepID=UPI000D3E7790|nr:acyclic terpene utilization AtuA family protein [Acuticoccus kandeliae]